jgi:rod shape-determining protein MreD
MNLAVSYTSREEIEVNKFGWAVSAGIPLAAIFIQVFFTVRLPRFMVFDLPLLVTIYFAVARRRPIVGLLTGAAIGTMQDSFGSGYIGVNGIANTIVGFLASSLGVKLDVENPGSRFLVTLAFFLVHQIVRIVIDVLLVGKRDPWNWGGVLLGAVANGLLAVILFTALDRLKMRA